MVVAIHDAEAIYSGQWRKIDWEEWKENHKFYFNKSEVL